MTSTRLIAVAQDTRGGIAIDQGHQIARGKLLARLMPWQLKSLVYGQAPACLRSARSACRPVQCLSQ